MLLNEYSTLYDVLDLKPDASAEDIRDAYMRTKAAYNKDSVALYTLISPEENSRDAPQGRGSVRSALQSR